MHEVCGAVDGIADEGRLVGELLPWVVGFFADELEGRVRFEEAG